LAGSIDVLAHEPPQEISPDGQVHVPAAQTWSPLHAIAQLPQWVASDVKSRHAPPHALNPAAHAWAHSPLLQRGAEPAQVAPQAPQLA
jgi:hypothetical protein